MRPLCAMLSGMPGTQKTGAVAVFLDAGYRVVVADFDGNCDPLYVFAKDTSKLVVVPFFDSLEANTTDGDGKNSYRRTNTVSAVRRFGSFMDRGDKELGLTPPATWGEDTVFLWDSLTTTAESAERLALKLNGGVRTAGAHIGVLGDEITSLVTMFRNPAWKCHRLMVTHLKLIGPKGEIQGETALQQTVKQERADLEEFRYVPNMPGNLVAGSIASKFPTCLLFEQFNGRHVIRTKPVPAYTIKVPATVEDRLPAETGLMTILKAMNGESAQ